jgi:hypothetical protein
MQRKPATKPSTVISHNEKADTSGMAGSTISYDDMTYSVELPKKPLCDMVKEVSDKRLGRTKD